MAGEKYIVASVENSMQIAVRNILNPSGYVFLANCSDGVTLLRLIRSYNPDFVVVDYSLHAGELRNALEVIDDEMLCACILVGDHKNADIVGILDNSKTISFCLKPLNRDMLLQAVDLSIISYRRIFNLNKKLMEVTENYETRKAVERAKRILMERKGLSEKEAYESIRKKSMNSRMPLKSIAESIIYTYESMGKNN